MNAAAFSTWDDSKQLDVIADELRSRTSKTAKALFRKIVHRLTEISPELAAKYPLPPINPRPTPQPANIYVVWLDHAVLKEPSFRQANPKHNSRKRCLYVGMTSLEPEHRFFRHLMGVQACRFVRRYGRDLLPRLYKGYNPLPSGDAKKLEVAYAERLRARGFAVWQN